MNEKKELNPFIIESLTTELDSFEIAELKDYIITETTFRNMSAECFEPHHGIVLKDSENLVLGYISICFQCNSYRFNSGFEIAYIPVYFFRKVVKNHNLPIKKKEIESLYFENIKSSNPDDFELN